MRYFLAERSNAVSPIFKTVVKDLRIGLSEEEEANRDFLHKYMTLTRCDLLFADRAILIEGTSERLLLPEMIRKYDDAVSTTAPKLSNQYFSIMEVGGAYAHRFFNLLEFLNLRTLIITDLDTVNEKDSRRKCRVSEGTHSSNACINNWYTASGKDNPTKDELLGKAEDEKILGNRRLAFQIPHTDEDACGRSFEDAFVLANSAKFGIAGATPNEREEQAWDLASRFAKTDFALKNAILDTDWTTPRYIEEGLLWLADNVASLPDAGNDVKVSETVEEGGENA
jgi:hypothetical protein